MSSRSDETIMVQRNWTIFLGGPPLVKAATGQVVTAEALGGAAVHTRQSGVADHDCRTERDALRRTRTIVATLGRRRCGTISQLDHPEHNHDSSFEEPLYPTQELRGIIPVDPKQSFDIRLIIARIVDGSRFHEFKQMYGPTLVTGFAKV